MSKLYPDISHHHPVQDWTAFSEAVGFAISKGTQGTSFIDSYLKTFVSECESHGIPYWLYVYLNKGNELKQTQFLVKTCKPLVGKYFVGYILDVEEDNSADAVRESLAYLKTLGGKCMVYTGWSDYTTYKSVLAGRGDNVAWWEARYGKDDGKYSTSFPCHKDVDLHQFTSNGVCPGVPDKIDLNRLTGNKNVTWFMSANTSASKPTTAKQHYAGEYPTLPSRGYYRIGDGMLLLSGKRKQIKLVQQLVNWITGGKLEIDGKYGKLTSAEVVKAQKILKVTADGLFGKATLGAAQAYKK